VTGHGTKGKEHSEMKDLDIIHSNYICRYAMNEQALMYIADVTTDENVREYARDVLVRGPEQYPLPDEVARSSAIPESERT
jgi:hypothetical protein